MLNYPSAPHLNARSYLKSVLNFGVAETETTLANAPDVANACLLDKKKSISLEAPLMNEQMDEFMI